MTTHVLTYTHDEGDVRCIHNVDAADILEWLLAMLVGAGRSPLTAQDHRVGVVDVILPERPAMP